MYIKFLRILWHLAFPVRMHRVQITRGQTDSTIPQLEAWTRKHRTNIHRNFWIKDSSALLSLTNCASKSKNPIFPLEKNSFTMKNLDWSPLFTKDDCIFTEKHDWAFFRNGRHKWDDRSRAILTVGENWIDGNFGEFHHAPTVTPPWVPRANKARGGWGYAKAQHHRIHLRSCSRSSLPGPMSTWWVLQR